MTKLRAILTALTPCLCLAAAVATEATQLPLCSAVCCTTPKPPNSTPCLLPGIHGTYTPGTCGPFVGYICD